MAKVSKSTTIGVSRDKLRRARERDQAATAEGVKAPARPKDGLIHHAGPAARCKGGPRDGRVYLVRSLELELRIAEEFGHDPSYVRTRAHTVLPGTGGVKGEVWKWAEPARPPLADVVCTQAPKGCPGCHAPLLHPVSRSRNLCERCRIDGVRPADRARA